MLLMSSMLLWMPRLRSMRNSPLRMPRLPASPTSRRTSSSRLLSEAAKKAKEAAVTNMDQVKGEVAQLITDIDTEYANVQALAQAASKDARKAAKAKLNVKDINAKVAAAGEAIAAAKAANDSGDYAGARDQLNAVKSSLDELKSTLEAAGFTAQ